MRDTVTSDLGEFGFGELREAARLLSAYCDNPSAVSLGENVRIFMNKNSGFVFLSDDDYSVAMMNGDKLEMFYSCPECGKEGFAEDLEDEGGSCWKEGFAEDLEDEGGSCCRAYLRELGAIPQINEDEEAGE